MNRDPRYDFFRGLALLAITVNHSYGPQGMQIQVGHFWFFDFADVFVFISGIVCGMAFFKRIESQGFANCQIRALRRAGTLYLANLATFGVCLCLVWVFGHVPDSRSFFEKLQAYFTHPYRMIPEMLLLTKPPYLFDVLNFYIVMVALAPLAIRLYVRNRPLAVLISLAGYGYVQLQPRMGWPNPLAHFVEFGNPLALQLLYCIGLGLGIEKARGTLKIPVNRTLVTAALLLLAAGFLARELNMIDLWRWSDKRLVRPARIVELLLVTYVVAACLPATRALWRSEWLFLFTTCGKRPLTIYCCGVAVSYWMILSSHAQHFEFSGYVLLNMTGVAMVMLVGMLLQLIADRHTIPSERPDWAAN